MTRGSRLAPLLALVVLCSLLPGVAAADSTDGYSIEATTSIDTPQRTLTILGRDFNVSSLGRVDEGETVRAAVSRPGDGDFTVYLYSYGGERLATVEGSQNGTYTLPGTDSLDPGTYLLALSIGGSFERVQPVVVSGYDFALEAPAEAPPDEPVSVDLTVTGDGPLPNYVEVVVMNDTLRRYTMAHIVDTRRYTVILDGLAPGTYRLYASAHNDSQVAGVSSVQTLEVGDPDRESTPTASPTPTASGGGSGTATTSGQSGGSGGPVVTTPSDGAPTVTTPESESPVVSPTAASPVASPRTRDPPTTTPGSDRRTTDSADASGHTVGSTATTARPNGTSATDGSQGTPVGTPVTTPGFTAVSALVGLAVSLFSALRD